VSIFWKEDKDMRIKIVALLVGATVFAGAETVGGDFADLNNMPASIPAELDAKFIALNRGDRQTATACVYNSGLWRCFQTNAEAERYTRQLDDQASVDQVASVTAGRFRPVAELQVAPDSKQCSGWVHFFQHINFNKNFPGRVFSYKQKGEEQTLPRANIVSSIQLPPDCAVILTDTERKNENDEAGLPYQARIGAGTSIADLRHVTEGLPEGQTWDNRVDKIKIE
jgi:hypothetical protein